VVLGLFFHKLARAVFVLDVRNEPFAIFLVFVHTEFAFVRVRVCGDVVVEYGPFDVGRVAVFFIVLVYVYGFDDDVFAWGVVQVEPGPNVSARKR
jgi:hypothetical protein